MLINDLYNVILKSCFAYNYIKFIIGVHHIDDNRLMKMVYRLLGGKECPTTQSDNKKEVVHHEMTFQSSHH